MMPPTPVGNSDLINGLKPFARMLATVFISAMGMMLFSMVGSLAYPVGGVGAIFGGLAGLITCALIGCIATGFWADMMPDPKPGAGGFNLGKYVPHQVAVQLGAHAPFTLILSVHAAVGVRVQGHMPWKTPDLYLQIECGSNPLKRTCVKSDGKFNEQFKLHVDASDTVLLIKIKDQDIFGSSDIGYVAIDIMQDIIQPSFPVHRQFPVEAGETDTLRFQGTDQRPYIEVSFDHTEDFLQTEHAADALQTKKDRASTLDTKWKGLDQKSGHYGAVSFLSRMEFNPAVKMEERDPSGTGVV